MPTVHNITDERKMTQMKKTRLYLAYQCHTIPQYEKAMRLAGRIEQMGYVVYLATNHTTRGMVGDVPLHVDTFRSDMDALLAADVVCICIDGIDIAGVELEVGAMLALLYTKVSTARVLVCDLCRTALGQQNHPLGDLYVSSREWLASVSGGISEYFDYAADIGTLLSELTVSPVETVVV